MMECASYGSGGIKSKNMGIKAGLRSFPGYQSCVSGSCEGERLPGEYDDEEVAQRVCSSICNLGTLPGR